MLEGATYFACLALFAFVLFASIWVRHELLLLACIPPFFVASIVGFVMWIYAWETFPPPVSLIAVALPFPVARYFGRRYGTRDLLLLIYLAWALGMVLALVAFSFPDSQG